MGKLSAGFDLATELRAQRRASRLTQAALAAKADLAERTVRALEHGSGTLDSWHAALRALGLRLSGRNLPGGATLGLRLTTLRRRRGLSQEALARSVGVSKPTLGALERDSKGRLSTLQRVLVVLGAGPYLAPREGSAAAFYTHAGNTSTHQAWETPATLLDALASIFGRFDLDPCRLQEIAEPRPRTGKFHARRRRPHAPVAWRRLRQSAVRENAWALGGQGPSRGGGGPRTDGRRVIARAAIRPTGMSTSPVGRSCISFAAGCASATENRPPRSRRRSWSMVQRPKSSSLLTTLCSPHGGQRDGRLIGVAGRSRRSGTKKEAARGNSPRFFPNSRLWTRTKS